MALSFLFFVFLLSDIPRFIPEPSMGVECSFIFSYFIMNSKMLSLADNFFVTNTTHDMPVSKE